MCYFIDNKNIIIVENEDLNDEYLSSNIIGTEYPIVPIITNNYINKIVLGKWRFNPNLPDDSKKRTIGLNINSEKAFATPMFKEYTHQHCIIPVNAFYEWKHFENHTIRIKHRITMVNEKTFYLAGFWRFYSDNKISFGILTTLANALMTEIHNSKLRMPISLSKIEAYKFLSSETLFDFQFPQYDPNLIAENLEAFKLPNTLF
jgi:putative SOS response-associated peptidase YedK